jgi:hypothetical protein
MNNPICTTVIRIASAFVSGFSGDFAFDGYISSLVPTGFVALNSAGFTDSSVLPGLSPPPNPIPEPET